MNRRGFFASLLAAFLTPRFFKATPAPAPLLDGVDYDAGPSLYKPAHRLDGLFAKVETAFGTDAPRSPGQPVLRWDYELPGQGRRFEVKVRT